MRKSVLCLVGILGIVLFLLPGCNKIVRDTNVYKMELDLMEQMAVQPTDLLVNFVKQDCKCVDGKMPTPDCQKAADMIELVKTRVPYHKAMMLYNASITKERPPKDPPVVPAGATLCQ